MNCNIDWSCFPQHTAQVTLAICITLPSFGTVKDIINLQYNWFFKTVWFPEGCVLQWKECSLENFENTPEEYMNLVIQVWLKFIRISKYTEFQSNWHRALTIKSRWTIQLTCKWFLSFVWLIDIKYALKGITITPTRYTVDSGTS